MSASRIIGIGNPDRGDDAAGLLVARRLGGIEVLEPLALMDAWEGAESVVLVDAVVTGAVPGTIFDWDMERIPPESRALRVSSHGVSVVEVYRLARVLGRAPGNVRVIGIEGACFGAGEPLTRVVEEAVGRVVALLV